MASRFVEPCGCASCGDVRYPCDQHRHTAHDPRAAQPITDKDLADLERLARVPEKMNPVMFGLIARIRQAEAREQAVVARNERTDIKRDCKQAEATVAALTAENERLKAILLSWEQLEVALQERDEAFAERDRAVAAGKAVAEEANNLQATVAAQQATITRYERALREIGAQATALHTTKTHLAAIAGGALGEPIYDR